MVVEPRLAVPRLRGGHIDHPPRRHDGLDDRRGDGAAPAGEDQDGGGERVGDHLDQPRRVGRDQAPGVAHHHHAPLHQERRGHAGVDDRPDAELLSGGTADLFDHERVVPVPDQLAQQSAHLLGHQRGVVAAHQVDRRRRHLLGAHAASLMAASASRARQVPRTSCTRTIRQPQAMPSAAAPMDASRRSVSSRPRTPPRKVLLEAESSRG